MGTWDGEGTYVYLSIMTMSAFPVYENTYGTTIKCSYPGYPHDIRDSNVLMRRRVAGVVCRSRRPAVTVP